MKKRVIAICSVLVALIGICSALYHVPIRTKIQATCNAMKLDANGNQIGQVQIILEGYRYDYLFQQDRLNIDIAPFDDWKTFHLTEDVSTGKTGLISRFFDKFACVNLYTVSPKTGMISFCKLYITDDFGYIALQIADTDETVYYVASANDSATAEQIIQHFQGIVPGYKAP